MAVGLATTEVVAGFEPASPSLLLSVGSAVIDRAPPVATEVAIHTLGTADKPAFVVVLVVLVVVIGAAMGRAAHHRSWVALPVVGSLGVVGTASALSHSTDHAAVTLSAGLCGAVACLGVLSALLPRAAAPSPPHPPGPVGEHQPPAVGTTRRSVLRLGCGVAGVVVAGTGAVRLVGRLTEGAASPPGVSLPRAASTGPAARAASTAFEGVPGLGPYITPVGDFYRIDTALQVPRVDTTSWRLRVTGMVERPVELTYDDLLALPHVEVPVTLSCVSNEVGGRLVGTAVWQGAPLAEVLALAGVRPGAEQVVGRSVDGWTGGFPLEVARDGRPALVAVGMNGEPLTPVHGFPARLVVSGLYGYVSAAKWLSEIELTHDGFDGYWVPLGWSKRGPVETQSRIDTPRSGDRVGAGPVTVAGVAWAPPRGISAVEVSVDGGSWSLAELAGELTPHTWRQWRHVVDLGGGRHAIRVRALDGAGVAQVAERSGPKPGGATGYHEVIVHTS